RHPDYATEFIVPHGCTTEARFHRIASRLNILHLDPTGCLVTEQSSGSPHAHIMAGRETERPERMSPDAACAEQPRHLHSFRGWDGQAESCEVACVVHSWRLPDDDLSG